MLTSYKPTAATASVAPIADPRDRAARAEMHAAQRRRDRLFESGTRVWAAYRLEHRDHPYQPLYSPQQRTPLGEICRYAGPGFNTDYYDVETDTEIRTLYHIVTTAEGQTRRVLAEDLRCVEIETPTASVPATLPVTCRALQLVEPLRQVLLRLVAHIRLILSTADRSLYITDGALHVGQHTILTSTPHGVRVDTVVYPIRASLVTLRRLVKTIKVRIAAAETARFFADLAHEVRTLPGLMATLIPRDGIITVNSNRYPRLKITVSPRGVMLSPHLSSFQRADGCRPAWFKLYDFHPDAAKLHAQIAASLQV